jgi:histidinol phosphatase-like PHP family hydrolase
VNLATHSRTGARRRKRGAGEDDQPPAGIKADINMTAAGLLHDMAALQPNERSQLGYKRAAKAVIGLPLTVGDLVAAGTLRDVPYIGPSSARIITELVDTGASSTVDVAVAASRQADKVASLRQLRTNFLSQVTMEQALALPRDSGVVSKGDFRGDFQMHSTWSDGGERIEAMANGCLVLGHTCMGITDHSYGLPIARGISMEDARRQHREIDRLNKRFAGEFRIFKGIEANILPDGELDLQPGERDVFDYVVASPHSQLRRDHDQTSRMLRAVAQPGVAMLGHPQGRMYNTRPGVSADWPRVFATAAKRGVAIEIDGNWHRQDVHYGLARQALEAGCIFALDSDAHSIGELRFTDYSIAHARIAGIPAERVINCWSDERLGEWMKERMQGVGGRR